MKRIVAAYTNTTSKGYKQEWVKAIADGVNKHEGWQGKLIDGVKFDETAEYSFVFNYQRESSTQLSKASHKMRKQGFERHTDGKVFCLDGDILISYLGLKHKREHLADMKAEMESGIRYVRIPFTHVYEPKARFFIKDNWEDRWQDIMNNKGINQVKEYDKQGDQILIVCNRGSEGYSGMGVPAWRYAMDTITELRKHSKRPIVVRLHRANNIYRKIDIEQLENFFRTHGIQGVKIQSKKYMGEFTTGSYPDLLEEINKSWAICTLASSAAGPALIEGKPVFVGAPECFFYNWRSGELSDIERPNYNIDRNSFFKKYSFAHWNYPEVRDGIFWENVKNEL